MDVGVKTYQYRCSKCQYERTLLIRAEDYNYFRMCPNCGIPMKEVKDA